MQRRAAVRQIPVPSMGFIEFGRRSERVGKVVRQLAVFWAMAVQLREELYRLLYRIEVTDDLTRVAKDHGAKLLPIDVLLWKPARLPYRLRRVGVQQGGQMLLETQ